MTKKFKKRYVLGEGYPWAMGFDSAAYKEIALSGSNRGFSPVILNWPEELWREELPKYKLILERIDE